MRQKPNEQVQGITADPVRRTYWVYTDQSILELEHKNEDRDVWKIYMEKGKYRAALQYAKVCQPANRMFVRDSSRCSACRRRNNGTRS